MTALYIGCRTIAYGPSEQIAVESKVIKLRNAEVTNRIQLHLTLGGSFDASPSVPELAGR
jgi:hypothetical protein